MPLRLTPYPIDQRLGALTSVITLSTYRRRGLPRLGLLLREFTVPKHRADDIDLIVDLVPPPRYHIASIFCDLP